MKFNISLIFISLGMLFSNSIDIGDWWIIVGTIILRYSQVSMSEWEKRKSVKKDSCISFGTPVQQCSSCRQIHIIFYCTFFQPIYSFWGSYIKFILLLERQIFHTCLTHFVVTHCELPVPIKSGSFYVFKVRKLTRPLKYSNILLICIIIHLFVEIIIVLTSHQFWLNRNCFFLRNWNQNRRKSRGSSSGQRKT